ncbi:MAG: metalloregulator ArsR/SmtB family transcription factor [Sphingomonas sp.]
MEKAFKALASEPRRRILNHLAGGPMTVGEIAEQFDMALPSISKHLSVLRDAGLVREQKRGQFVLYTLRRRSDGEHPLRLPHALLPRCPQDRRRAAPV